MTDDYKGNRIVEKGEDSDESRSALFNEYYEIMNTIIKFSEIWKKVS